VDVEWEISVEDTPTLKSAKRVFDTEKSFLKNPEIIFEKGKAAFQ